MDAGYLSFLYIEIFISDNSNCLFCSSHALLTCSGLLVKNLFSIFYFTLASKHLHFFKKYLPQPPDLDWVVWTPANPPHPHTYQGFLSLWVNWPQYKVHLGTYILRFTRIVDENQSSPTIHSWSSHGSCLLFPEQLNLQSNLNTQPCSYRKGQLSPLIREPCFCSRWRPFQEVTTGQNACLHSVHLQYNI